jgi:FtsP/CotA-like multicopper oxidase with cupredoxin domain
MRISRRQFLGSAAALLGSATLCRAEALTADGFIEIRAQPVTLGLLEGGAGKTGAWLFGKGPEPAVIHARQGQEMKLRFINDLDREIWLHFFGVRGPSDVMTLNVPPGADQAVDAVFTPPDAGTFWIGPMLEQSRLRGMGLSAVLVVEEAEPLPAIADRVLVIDDWKLQPGGAVEDSFGDVEAMVGEGRLGNWFTLNNRFRPRIALNGAGYTRLRIVNAGNARNTSLLFKGGDPLLIARDGQPVKPAQLGGKPLELAPGQRADLLAGVEGGDIALALALFEDVAEIGYLTAAVGQGTPPAIAENFTLPANPVSVPKPGEASRAIAITLEGGLRGGLSSAFFNGATRDLRTLLENGKGWAMNGVAGPSPVPLFSARRGETLRLDIENRTAFAQPLHIHGHVWQEDAAEPTESLRDTAIIPAGQRVSLTFVADNPGLWAIHSLVAERADGGLLASFSVEDA